jgi:glycosyltransferase involved in cell wall biosynthesis
MQEKVKFTILLPTRERADTLYHTIRACLNQTYPNYEIVVSDNYSQDNTYDVVHSFNDSRLRYINTGKRMSMSENFDFALSHVRDGYVMFIGDDDGVVPNSLEYVNEIINTTGTEAVVSHNAFYTWPETANPNKLYLSDKSGYEIRSSKEWIKKYLTFKMAYTFDLPGAYCGFAKKDVFDRVSKDGYFFHSSTPDAYSAIAVAFATDTFVYSSTPFAVHGASKNSNGGAFLSKKKGEEGKESISFLKENKIPFHKDIVFTKAFRVSSLEAYLQFSGIFPELTKEYKIDWKRFLQYVLTERQENTKKEIEEAVKQMCQMHSINYEEIRNFKPSRSDKLADLTFIEIIKKAKSKITSKLLNKTTHIEDTTQYGVYNVHDAMILLKCLLIRDN